MPQKDFIVTPITTSAELIFDQKQLYNYFKKWFEERHYNVNEKDYREKTTPAGKRVFNFTWMCEKKVDDYTTLIVEVSYNAEADEVTVTLEEGKKKSALQGEVSATLQGYILKDVEDEWAFQKEKPWRRVIREAYDKLVQRGKYAGYEAQLKKEVKAIVSDFKTYLKVHRYD